MKWSEVPFLITDADGETVARVTTGGHAFACALGLATKHAGSAFKVYHVTGANRREHLGGWHRTPPEGTGAHP